MFRNRPVLCNSHGVVLLCVLLCAPGARGDGDDPNLIDLEWRPAAQTVLVGTTVEIGLYAAFVDEGGYTDGSISAMDVLLDWDPDYLSLLGNNTTGAYPWMSSTFPNDELNDDWLDGDAYYRAFAYLGTPAYATEDGLLVTTIQFEALAETSETTLSIPLYPPRGYDGRVSQTSVFDGEIPGLDVHGALGSALVEIIPEPATFALLALPTVALLSRRRVR